MFEFDCVILDDIVIDFAVAAVFDGGCGCFAVGPLDMIGVIASYKHLYDRTTTVFMMMTMGEEFEVDDYVCD